MALDKDRDRSQSPDRNQKRRLNKREILLSRELSANKQKNEPALIRMQSMASNSKNPEGAQSRPLPRAPNRIGSNDKLPRNDGSVSSQNRNQTNVIQDRQSVINRQKLLLSPGVTNMRISLDDDTVAQNKRGGRNFDAKDHRQPQLTSKETVKESASQIIEQPKPVVSAELKQKAEHFHA